MTEAGEEEDKGEAQQPIRKAWAAGAIALALYAPQMWFISMDYPWNDYRFFWLKFFPGLPAFIPGIFLPYPNENFMAIGLWIITGAAASGAFILSRRNERLFYAALAGLFLWSIFSAVMAYTVFRA